ncbi:hypothetical protein TrLO_g268 [Triparma laevis f. longispina]|uniref:WW domain-containing protein n=1 Tax=Triparma laevis f. longispina TaxID=1714387 RepID=A0A9W7CG61_9STRA|nr:hypothetical protein TrLO_g268 [Triparma laevis f. longispina]
MDPPPKPSQNKRASVTFTINNPMAPRGGRTGTHVAGGDIALALMQDRVNNGLSALPTNVVQRSISKAPPRLSTIPSGGEASDPPKLPEGWEEIVNEEDGSIYYFNRDQNVTQWTHPALGEDEEVIIDLLDPSMIFSLERTTLSGYNQAFSIMMVGAGIMAVKNATQARNISTPVDIGLVWFVSGVLYTGHTWYLHLRRMHVLKHGDKAHRFSWQWSSIWWMSSLGFLLTVGFAIEVYYAIKYPYFERSKQVEIVSTDAPAE